MRYLCANEWCQMAAPRNAMVNIAPVVKYYIGAFSSSVGTVINTSVTSRNCAVIDFTGNPGMFSANVNQDSNGNFTVTYLPHASFAMAMSVRRVADVGGKAHLRQLGMQL